MTTPLPTKEQADQSENFMVDQVHCPAFFEKLAANGLQPKTEAEARQLLQLGATLKHAEDNGQLKQAQDDGNPLLTHALEKLAGEQPQPGIDAQVKQSADALIGESELAKTAALVYAHVVSGGDLTEAPEAAATA